MERAITAAEALKNPTEQCWELRQCFDLIKQRGRGGGAAATSCLSSEATCAVGRAAEQAKEVRVKREKQDKQLVNTCKEIHQTEKAFVADLQTVVSAFMGPAREQEVQAQEPRSMSVVEFLETEELEDDCSSSIPRALSVNLPPATAVESRYAIYSLRELPCVPAEEIQEI